MCEKPKFYITTAIAYTSRKPHIGNSYEIVLTDAIARYKRMLGYDVFFLTGTDEHGQKIEEYAKAAGVSPKAYVDKVAGEIRGICDALNTTYDKFIRTTDDYHEKAVQKMFKKLYDQGDIYKSEYEGLYCTLEEFIENNENFIYPEARKKEMLNNFIKPGLQDLCVSRTSFKWGIPVTFDDKHVIYVWLDALSNYITALGYDPDGSGDAYKKYWPVFLMALGEPLPKQVYGHPWLLFGEDKMSKSRGNVIYADDLIKVFGVDAVRYYLLSEMPHAADGSITYETMIERYNSDLANTIGNLVNRTVAMQNKYFDGVVQSGECTGEFDKEVKALAVQTLADMDRCINEYKISDSVACILTLARRLNKYIDETMPWALAKDEAQKARLGTVLYNLLEGIRYLAVLLTPYMPDTSAAIFEQLGTEVRDYESLKTFGGLKVGERVGTATPLFSRIDAEKLIAELTAAQKAETEAEKKTETPKIEGLAQIGIEDFMKVELRVAEVTACEPVKRAKKLLKLTLNDGTDTPRTVASGIAKWYAPDDLVGKKIVLVANLKPAVLCGVESQGMILAADCSEDDVKVVFVDSSMPNGARIR